MLFGLFLRSSVNTLLPFATARGFSRSAYTMTQSISMAATDFKSTFLFSVTCHKIITYTKYDSFTGDTVTTPTESMLKAMLTATHGDDVYKEDKTTNDFQERVAKMAGKPAGLFVVSGTMGNQICLRAHLHQPPYSILCDYRGHVYTHEAAGLAMLSQAMVTPVHPKKTTYITAEDIQANLICKISFSSI